MLVGSASKELGFHHDKFEDMRVNIDLLDEREQFQHKNLRGLVKYAKKLTRELEDYKGKVSMAERIIEDLRSTGNESLDSLINMLNSYRVKEVQTMEEMKKLKKLVALKDEELLSLDEDIAQLRGFVSVAKHKQEEKLVEL
mmetsp:Transcript_27683/g.20791  ORF Transcript_27683/g.20791 Transcript_27683/m.20791 type:complete len:141 (+) Transcript_27683:209-631(+)